MSNKPKVEYHHKGDSLVERSSEHRRVAQTTESRFTTNEQYLEQLLAAIQDFVDANNLGGWNPPPIYWNPGEPIGG